MPETILKIEGMGCQHYVMRMKKAITLLPGVMGTQVDVGIAKITYDETRLKKEGLKRAAEEAGYAVVDQARSGE